jgi:DNA-binding transcriptional LysR family regulator
MNLNLLLVFEALWAERHVTRAGRRLGLSQPAMSGALARLRELMKDPLFIRGRGVLVPTERCVALAAPLSKALLDIRNALAGVAFEPNTTERTLTLGAVDAAIAVVVPKVAARFSAEAPRATLAVSAIDPMRAVDLVEAGVLDVALTPRVRPSATVMQRTLFPLEFWVATRRGHPLWRSRLTPNALLRWPRLAVSFDGAPPTGGALGIKPVLSVGSFLAVPHVLKECDAWAVLPAPFAQKLIDERTVEARPMHGQLPKLAMQMIWPQTQDAAPASRWLRGLIVEAISAAPREARNPSTGPSRGTSGESARRR